MSWEESLELRASKTYPDNGYYLSNQVSLKETLENLSLNFWGIALRSELRLQRDGDSGKLGKIRLPATSRSLVRVLYR